MITMEERSLIRRVKALTGLEISKGWPGELSFRQIIKLYSDDKDKDKDKEKIDIVTEGLEEATFNKEIEARRAAFHLYHYPTGAGWKKDPLEAQEIEQVECAYRGKQRHIISRPNSNWQISTLLNCAEVRLNRNSMDFDYSLKPFGIHKENFIILDWFYNAEILSLWLKLFGTSPGELLGAWFKAKGCLLQENTDNQILATNLKKTIKLNPNECLPGFPKSRPGDKALAIFAACEDFIEAHGLCPSAKQIMNQMLKKSPRGFIVVGLNFSLEGYKSVQNASANSRLDAIKINDEVIKVSSFLRLCRSYLPPKMEDSGE